MIDNIKFYINNKDGFEENINKNESIDLKTFVSTFTGEMTEYPKTGKYFNMEARITEKQAFLKGSLHKFINMYLEDKEHNYNDFDLRDIKLVVDEIVNTLEIKPDETSITNLEFGFNIELDEDPQEIIDNRLLMNNFKNHSKDLKFRGRGNYKEFELTDYSIKVYNKSKQYQQDKYILRIEIKFTAKRKLNLLGIHTLSDLTNTEVLRNLFNFLMIQFDKLIIIDAFYDRKDISQTNKRRLTMFTNPNYWKNIDTKQLHIKEKLIREYKSLIKKYNLDKTKNVLREKICNKFTQLMRGCTAIY